MHMILLSPRALKCFHPMGVYLREHLCARICFKMLSRCEFCSESLSNARLCQEKQNKNVSAEDTKQGDKQRKRESVLASRRSGVPKWLVTLSGRFQALSTCFRMSRALGVPGLSCSAHGLSCSVPGLSCSAPGLSCSAPGLSCSALTLYIYI